jgi:outer membrane protein
MYPIIKELLVLVRRVAGQNGYDMVLNKESVPYFRSDLDITDRVIQLYNTKQTGSEPASKSKETPTPKPRAPATPKDKIPK